MNNNVKKADNELLQNKERIKEIENEIDEQNEQKRVLENLKENFIEIKNSLDKCYNLMQYSMKKNNLNNEYEEIENRNTKNLIGLTEEIDNDKRKIQKRIDDLIEEKNKKS